MGRTGWQGAAEETAHLIPMAAAVPGDEANGLREEDSYLSSTPSVMEMGQHPSHCRGRLEPLPAEVRHTIGCLDTPPAPPLRVPQLERNPESDDSDREDSEGGEDLLVVPSGPESEPTHSQQQGRSSLLQRLKGPTEKSGKGKSTWSKLLGKAEDQTKMVKGSAAILNGLSPRDRKGRRTPTRADKPRNLDKSHKVISVNGRAALFRDSHFAVKKKRQQIAKSSRTVFLFSPTNRLRKLCQATMSTTWFEYGVMAVIVANCLVLALYQPTKPEHILNKVSEYGEYIITGLFTVEFLIKVIAMGGFMHSGAYLGNWLSGEIEWWNVLDLAVILLGFVSLIPGSENYQVIRTLRLLRPMASVSTSTSMRVLIKALIGSLQMLVDVLLLCSLLYLLFGIIGVEIWMGTFRSHCVEIGTDNIRDVNEVCNDSSCGPNYECRSVSLDNTTYFPNPNHGLTSFDSFGHASVVVFQALFSEGWVQISEYTTTVSGEWAKLYWVALIILGCFFVVNLAIGVVFSSFTRVTELERQANSRRRRAEQSRRPSQGTKIGEVGEIAKSRWHVSGQAVLAGVTLENGARTAQDADSDSGDSSGSVEAALVRRPTFLTPREVTREHASNGDVESVVVQPDLVPTRSGVSSGVVPRLHRDLPGFLPFTEEISPAPPGQSTERSSTTPRTAREVQLTLGRGSLGTEFSTESEGDITQPVCEASEARTSLDPWGDSTCRSWQSFTSQAVLRSGEPDDPWVEGGGFSDRGRHLTSWSPGPLAEATEDESDRDLLIPAERSAEELPELSAGCLGRLKSYLNFVAESAEFQGGIALAIVLNTLTMSLVHYPMDSTMGNALETCNLVFLCMFTLEALLKAAGLGVKAYLKDAFNLFDLVIVLVSWAEIAMDSLTTVNFPGLTALRALRLLRILKLLNHWASLSNLAVVILQGFSSLGSFLVVLFIFIFTFALLGMQIFSGKMCRSGVCTDPTVTDLVDCSGSFTDSQGNAASREWHCVVYNADPSAYNFDNAWHALLSTFQVFTGENWHLIMYAAVEGTSMWSCLYFVSVVVFGHYLLLNLFLAGIVRHVVDQHSVEKQEDRKNRSKRNLTSRRQSLLTSGMSMMVSRFGSNVSTGIAPRAASAIRRLSVHDFQHMMSMLRLSSETDPEHGLGRDSPATSSYHNGSRGPRAAFVASVLPEESRLQARLQTAMTLNYRPSLQIGWLEQRADYALYLIPPNNRFRQFCISLTTHRNFDIGIVVLVILSSILLAVQNPNNPFEGVLGEVFAWLDVSFTALFLAEMVLKVVALGLLWPKTPRNGLSAAYLRNSWNVMDLIIVALSVLSLCFDSPSLKVFKALRTGRAIRPLRLLSKSEGMRQVVRSLGRVVAESGSIMVLLLLFWLIFSILGVELFSGKFHCCNDPTRVYQEGWAKEYGAEAALECSGQFTDPRTGLEVERQWVKAVPNFDNTGAAMLTLFEITTLEDWDAVMQMGINARGEGICPKNNANPANALFFIAYIVFGALFMFNLVVSAVIHEYIQSKDHGGYEISMLNVKQTEWVDTIKTWLNTRPEKVYRPPKSAGWLRRHLYRLVLHRYFETFILGCIFVNVLVMMCDHWGAPELYWTISNYLNLVFGAIFVVEAILKIAGMRMSYFHDRWNQLDFAIVTLNVVMFAVSLLTVDINLQPALLRLIRMFRAARVLRVAKRAKGMRMLLRTFKLSLPSLWHVGSILFIVFVVFAVLGMYLLGGAERAGMINDRINFETFGSSMFVLFFTLTGENWPSLLHGFMNQGLWEAVPFFVSFIGIAFFILLNLFLAVILDRFTETKRMEEYHLTTMDFGTFSEVWTTLDPDATLVIPAVKLEGFVSKLPTPLGIQGMGFSRIERQRLLQSLHLQGYGNECVVHYHEVLFALSYRLVGTTLPRDVEKALVKICARAFPELLKMPPDRVQYKLACAATRIQAAGRGYLARKKLASLRRAAVTAAMGGEAAARLEDYDKIMRGSAAE